MHGRDHTARPEPTTHHHTKDNPAYHYILAVRYAAFG